MRAVLQRVNRASVRVEGELLAEIGAGILALIGIRRGDKSSDALRLARKIVEMRLFEDEEGRMNRSLEDSQGELLLVSQFTLYGDTRKGRRPSFIEAAPAEEAADLYQSVVAACDQRLPGRVKSGRFQAMMDVELVNSGPVTLLVELSPME